MIPRSALETKVVEGEGASLCWAMAMAFVNSLWSEAGLARSSSIGSSAGLHADCGSCARGPPKTCLGKINGFVAVFCQSVWTSWGA